jgi:hypothetical protein
MIEKPPVTRTTRLSPLALAPHDRAGGAALVSPRINTPAERSSCPLELPSASLED